jgi:hypothetical protein
MQEELKESKQLEQLELLKPEMSESSATSGTLDNLRQIEKLELLKNLKLEAEVEAEVRADERLKMQLKLKPSLSSFDDDEDENLSNVSHTNDPLIDRVKKAIETFDIDYLSHNKDLIKRLYETNDENHSQCFCGAPHSYSLFTSITRIPSGANMLSTNDEAEKAARLVRQDLFYKSSMWLIDNDVINPNIVLVHDKMISNGLMAGKLDCPLSYLLSAYAGWEFDRKIIRLWLKKTDKSLIRDFRDQNDVTMLQKFLMCHCYDDSSKNEYGDFCREVVDQLLQTGVNLNNVSSSGHKYSKRKDKSLHVAKVGNDSKVQNEDDDNVIDGDNGGNGDNIGNKDNRKDGEAIVAEVAEDDLEYIDHRFTTLTNAVNAHSIRLIKMALDQGADPNFIDADDEFDCLENMAQGLLHRSRYMHCQDHILEVADILSLLCDAGLDLHYVTTDGRNIMDYVVQNGWTGTEVEKVLLTKSAKTSLVASGKVYAGKKTFWRTSQTNNDDFYAKNPHVQLLRQNKYLKDPVKLEELFKHWSLLKRQDVPIFNKQQYTELYSDYIVRYDWDRTIIGKQVELFFEGFEADAQCQQLIKDRERLEGFDRLERLGRSNQLKVDGTVLSPDITYFS